MVRLFFLPMTSIQGMLEIEKKSIIQYDIGLGSISTISSIIRDHSFFQLSWIIPPFSLNFGTN
jgi:hypothetical protein